MRYMFSVREFYDLLQTPCAEILLFVDASTTTKLSLMLISVILRINSSVALSNSFFFLPNLLMFRGVLVLIQCIQTRFTVDSLILRSLAIDLVLLLLVL